MRGFLQMPCPRGRGNKPFFNTRKMLNSPLCPGCRGAGVSLDCCIKELITKAPCLTLYSLEAEIKLVVDVSPCGLGCVLQEIDNQMRPVAYASRS